MTLKEGAYTVLKQCMGAKKNENIVIVTDDNKINLGEALYEEAKKISNSSVLIKMPVQQISGTEPSISVAEAMASADVVVCPTSSSITHTKARLNAVEAGARVATMPGITEKMFSEGPIKVNYDKVSSFTDKLTRLLDKAGAAKIITGEKNEYELILNISNRSGVSSKGIYTKKGESGNLPSGESYIAPNENHGVGEILIDGSIVGLGKLKSPVLLTMENGKIVNFEGNISQEVNNNFPSNIDSRTIAELGIGTNPLAKVTGVILEDEKIYGSIHVAFGTNITFGGNIKASSHIDCVTLKPSLYLDDIKVIENGDFVNLKM